MTPRNRPVAYGQQNNAPDPWWSVIVLQGEIDALFDLRPALAELAGGDRGFRICLECHIHAGHSVRDALLHAVESEEEEEALRNG